MKLSIIIVNYKAWDFIGKALDALQPDFPEDWEVIIVDNESEADAFQAFENRYSWVTLIANPENSGFGCGCIIGVDASTGAELLFMNPDVIATVADIRELIAVKSAHTDIGLISPKQVGDDGKPQKVFDEFPAVLNQSKILKHLSRLLAPGRHPDPRAEHTELVYCDWVTGSFLLVSRSDYEAMGGWSKDYWMYVEDADLCRKAHNIGLKVAYTPDVEVFHAHGGSSRINVAVKSMTKLEVIISKHVFTENHEHGPRRWLIHGLIGTLRLPGLVVAALLDLLTLGQIPTLRVRTGILRGLMGYYAEVIRTGSWLSPRAKRNQS